MLGDEDIDFQWNELIQQGNNSNQKSLSYAMRKQRRQATKKPKKVVTVGSGDQKYTAERLLHPWQRDLESLRKKVRGEAPQENTEEDAEEDFDDDTKIISSVIIVYTLNNF